MYLMRSSAILYQILSTALNHKLKKKDEQTFMYEQLELLDKQYCLEMEQQLWQSYFDVGLKYHIWPDQLYTMANTNDFQLCKEYLINYLQNIKTQLGQYQIELTKHFQSCPVIPKLSFDQIQHCRKELVDRERKYLSMRNNGQLIKFKDNIDETNLFNSICTSSLIHDQQNESIQRLITIYDKQAAIWKEQVMLESRILCKFLPQNLDSMENFIAPITYVPIHDNQKIIGVKNKRFKTIQETKRKWLNYFFNTYEFQIIECEQQYQCEFIKLQTQLLNNSTTNNSSLQKDIYNEMSSFQRITIQNRERSLSSTATKHTIGLFKSTTLLCTFDIQNLFTKLPLDEALNILMEFLHVHGYTKVKGINLDTIRKLASIVLKENVFVYGQKIYKLTTGGAMGSLFTLMLANIFMWNWQKKLVDEQTKTGEFFGRYIDDIFMTWNKSEDGLRQFLADANIWHPNIARDILQSSTRQCVSSYLLKSNFQQCINQVLGTIV
ncbi:unnamed protein product [Didymodactylos carnosus]|uniref:Reverse transcriptase domain-containing protein n=1 Tax=Didymodactylos carnosus TaxID=1234261 RepID=A0A815BP54_9BILA|nr:unnamed protein product [Didymodactylos carnosus]CAF4061718.1 unnamed protein product [Didymodactylos carnosus]